VSHAVYQFYLALTFVGLIVLLLGLVTGSITNRLYVSETLVAFALGVLVGPLGLHIFDLGIWGPRNVLLENAARITLAIALMGSALRLPAAYPMQTKRDLGIMLGPLMVLMWLSTSAIIWLVLRLVVWQTLLIGAILTPTDPVVAGSVVTGDLARRVIPSRIRNIISATSGANDGLGYPLVRLPIIMLAKPAGAALLFWAWHTIFYEVLLAVLLGAALGALSGHLVNWSRRHETGTPASYAALALALSLGVVGMVRLMGSDSILAVFVAGLAFRRVSERTTHHPEEWVQDAVSRLLTLPIFVLLGMVIPWHAWTALGWRAALLSVAVLLLRQLPSVLLLRKMIASLVGLPDALFLGWFGPIGISAVFYAALAVRETGMNDVWTISSLLIAASVVVFGITATPLTRLYGHYRSANENPRREQERRTA